MYFTGRVIHQMLQQAKSDNLTIKVRYAKILFCGEALAGKPKFSHLLRNKKLDDAQQVLLAGKINLEGTNWINLDSKSEIQELTKRLIDKNTKKEKASINSTTTENGSICAYNDNYSVNDAQTDNQTEIKAVNAEHISTSNLVIEEDMAGSQSFSPMSKYASKCGSKIDLLDSNVQSNIRISIEDQMISCTNAFDELETISETWDIFTLLDTGGQPEFINMLPVINSSTAITFVVLNISDGKDSLKSSVTMEYECAGYDNNEHDLTHTNKHQLKSLLSSVKVAAMKKDNFNAKTVKIVTEDQHPMPVVYIIGTCTNVGKISEEEILKINEEVTELVDEIEDKDVLQFCSTLDEKIVILVDDTIVRMPQKEDVKSAVVKSIQSIHAYSNEILKEKAQYEIPISWFILELELRSNDKACIPLTEVKDICDKIMPPHRRMQMEQIKEIMIFFHFFGTLLYFGDVDGMNKYVITKAEWLFCNLAKIVMCKSVNNATRLYGFHLIKEMNKGICSMELLNKLNLDLGIELQSFLNLLVHLKVIAPLGTKKDAYFIPTILPPYPENNIFTKNECGEPTAFTIDGKPIQREVEPILIQFSFGTIPRGLFGFLVVQLLKDYPPTYKVNDNNDHIIHRCADFICFYANRGRYISLHDKISYLELQIRVIDKQPSYHNEVLNTVTEALKKVCDDEFKFDWLLSNYWRFGFLCHKHEDRSQSEHLTLLSPNPPYNDEIPQLALCGSWLPTPLSKAHTVWFEVCCYMQFSCLIISYYVHYTGFTQDFITTR